jgi:transaldolase
MDRAEAEAIAVERPITASDLRVKVFADGADLDAIRSLYADPLITGFTTNPTLMRKAGISDYASFARAALEIVSDRPISFEVFSDEPAEMERQALKIASWGENVYVKIPVTNTSGIATDDLLGRLSDAGVKLNVTGMMTLSQVERVLPHIDGGPSAVVSVFAGRIADTGVDPIPIMTAVVVLVQRRTPMGESARGAEHRPGGSDWLSRDHGHARPPEEAPAPRPRSGRFLARDREDVPSRCPGGRLHPLGCRNRHPQLPSHVTSGILTGRISARPTSGTRHRISGSG